MSDPTKPSPYRERNRAYYIANRELILARSKAWRESHREEMREYKRERQVRLADQIADARMRRSRGIGLQEYGEMLTRQNGLCAICRNPERSKANNQRLRRFLCVDHDHETGKVRGLLCNRCNTAIGLLSDDEGLMFNAALYLQRATLAKRKAAAA